jgi:hypothetical protein
MNKGRVGRRSALLEQRKLGGRAAPFSASVHATRPAESTVPKEEHVMAAIDSDGHPWIYKVECEGGRRYLVYNASVLGNPPDHIPDKWYVREWTAPSQLGAEVSGPFETAEEAERVARAKHVQVG